MFKDKDVVCFLGDSITASGLWMAEVYQFLKKEHKIKCYNCGVSGSSAEKAVGYLYSECLIHSPNYVVLMFGMNDLGLFLYTKDKVESEELKKQREEWFSIHKQKYEEIIKSCKDFGAEVIVCLPTPYDEITEGAGDKASYQQALDRAASFQLEMAQKYNCKVVNFKDTMLNMLGKKTIIKEDRIHPSDYGHHVMAQIFLKEIGRIKECDFDTPFEFEEWNFKRYNSEQKNNKLNYVELCDMYSEVYVNNKSIDEIKELIKQKLAKYEDVSGYIPQAYIEYIKDGHLRLRNKGETVKLTIF